MHFSETKLIVMHLIRNWPQGASYVKQENVSHVSEYLKSKSFVKFKYHEKK